MTINIGIDSLKAAREAVAKVDVKHLRDLRKEIDTVLAAEDAKNSASARRLARMQAAASNPEMEPVVRLARGHLHRIGLDLHAAADINKLNEALTEAKLDTVKRIEIKQLLFQIGVID